MPELAETAVSLLLFVVWQVITAWFCLRLAPARGAVEERVLLWIAFDVVLNSISATILSFSGLNSPAAYAAIAVALVLMGRRMPAPAPLDPAGAGLKSWAIPALFLPLLFVSVRPVEEVDSLYNVHFVLDWVANRATPFTYAFNYPPFWELGYVPALVIGRSDLLLWVISLKAVVILGLALLLIARELDIPPKLAACGVAAALAFPHLWHGYSGVGTLKNDMIVAAGHALTTLLVIRAARRRLERADLALLALAVAFLGTKFNGPIFLTAAAGLAFVFSCRWCFRHPREALSVVGVALVSGLATSGPYYLRNLIEHGNPLYPYQINVAFLQLPGRADLSPTSILFNLHYAQLWREFFLPEGGLSPAGLLFPVTLAAVLAVIAAVLVREAYGWARGRREVSVALALCLLQALSWYLYFRGNFSAGTMEEPLRFVVNRLNSVRLVEGPLLVAEVALLALLAYWRVPATLLYGLTAVQFASRMWLLFRPEPSQATVYAVAASAVVIATTLALVRLKPRLMPAVAVSLMVIFGAAAVDRRRPAWLAEYQSLYQPLYSEQPSTIHLVVDDLVTAQLHLALLGERHQHDVVVGDVQCLESVPSNSYVVWVRLGDFSPPSLPQEFRVTSDSAAGMVWVRGDGRSVATTTLDSE